MIEEDHMGSTGVHREPGMTDRAFFEAELPVTLTQHGRILACATIGNVFYAAVENGPEAAYKPGETWALVVKMIRTRDYFNLTYKDMSEQEGPCYYDCPDKILNLLSPTGHEYASEWRQECRDRNARKARARKVKAGTVVRFSRPFEFTDGHKGSEFTFVQRSTFRVPGTGRYRISDWRVMDFEIAVAG